MIETLWYIGGILFIALGIGISIGLHEIGHMLPAKKFGIKVPTYAIGFGPTLFKFTRGETTYAIKLIPLGGYISMIGMYPPAKPGAKMRKGFFGDMVNQARDAHSQHVTPTDKNRMFYQRPVWQRLIIMFGGPFMNLLLGTALMATVISGIGINTQSTTIAKVMPCVVLQPRADATCLPTDAVSPAKKAGLKDGDKILAVDGKAITDSVNFSLLLTSNVASAFTIERDGKKLSENIAVIPITAVRVMLDTNGNTVTDKNGKVLVGHKPVIGIVFGSERVAQPISKSLEQSAWGVGQVAQMITTLPQQLTDVAISTFTGKERNANGAVSVVGIAQISGEVASASQVTFIDKLATGLMILASLNFALFGFNMLPLLPLDGGHIAGGIYESIKRGIFKVLRRKDPGPADTALLTPITWFVFISLMAMSALLILADLINPIRF